MIKILKETFRWGTVGASLLFSLILSGILSTIVATDTTISPIPVNIFKGTMIFAIAFVSTYAIMTVERLVETYKRTIHEQRTEIDYLKKLVLEKEEIK